MPSLFLMEVINAQDSSTLSTFGSSVSFPLLTFLSLVSFPVFSKSVLIKLGDISSSILTPESYQVPIHSAKIQSAS